MASGVKDLAAGLAVISDDGRAGEQRAGRCVKRLCELTCMVLPNVSPWTVYSTRTDSLYAIYYSAAAPLPRRSAVYKNGVAVNGVAIARSAASLCDRNTGVWF